MIINQGLGKRPRAAFDLPAQVQRKIQEVLVRYPQVEEAVLFGSRALGTSKLGSDIDLALKGPEINLHVLNRISCDLDDLLIPNAIDLCIYHRIQDQDVVDHIQRVGKTIYSRERKEEF